MSGSVGSSVRWGERVLVGGALVACNVETAGGRIVRVAPGKAEAKAERLPDGSILAPGLIDLQVNGGGGVLLNETPTADGIRAMVAAHRAHGTTAMLPTLITDAPGLMEHAASAVCAVRAGGGSGVLGLHLEGPFISPARPGVHDGRWIRTMTDADAALLAGIAAQAGIGRLKLTLAPETVADQLLVLLADAGIVLSAGHTEAGAERMAAARALGVACCTHLFNAMPPIAGRAPGPVGACLSDHAMWCGIIADGVHVDPVNLRLAHRCKAGRLFLVSDAMAVAGTALPGFALQGRWITRADGRLTAGDGTLAGADLTMIGAVRTMVQETDAGLEEALAMATSAPASVLRLTDRGRIAEGAFADFVLLDAGLSVLATAVEGAWTRH